jgi:cob(I)alamin adenosyltransferase
LKKGLLIINTGDGKGKTTAALGTAFRALGHGLRVCVIQFIKGSWKYGELEAAKRFSDLMEFHVMGKGFTWKSKDLEEDKKVAGQAWIKAKDAILSGAFDLIILDELTYLMIYKMVPEEEIIETLLYKPENLHIVVTGRDAPKALIDAADMVNEMGEIKHPFREGIRAQRGIEF